MFLLSLNYANCDCWQQYFGYINLYDYGFALGTNMERVNFSFNYNSNELMFWVWVVDYINLGAGAELGIYKSLDVNGVSKGHWVVDKNLALPMTLTLKYKENTIIEYKPGKKQWWITSFNPSYKGIKASNLTAIYTIDFSGNKDMFEAFYNSDARENGWEFDNKNYMASFTF